MDADHPRIGADRPSLRPDLGDAVRAIHEQFDDHVGEQVVEEVLDGVAAQFDDAPVRAFVPLLVHRYSKDELARRAGTIDLREPSEVEIA